MSRRARAIDNTELVFVGYGVEAPEFNWNDFKDVDVKGKTIVVLVNDPQVPDPADPSEARSEDVQRQGDDLLRPLDLQVRGRARKRGAAGVLIVHETGPAGYPFPVVQGNLGEKFDLVTPDKNMGRAAIEGWITLDAAKKIFAMAGQDFDALKKQAVTREFRPVPLGLTASMAIKNTLRTIDSRNVLAKLEGSDPQGKNEYVVYTAHWDHLGVGDAVNGDKIYNGAQDNASGVAALLEIARAFTQVQPAPKRSILFLMVTAEEQGLLGSQYYSVTPVYPLAKTLANINMDGVNQWGRTKDITRRRPGRLRPRRLPARRGGRAGADVEARRRSRRRGSTTGRITSTSRSRACRRSTPTAASTSSASRRNTASRSGTSTRIATTTRRRMK